MVRRAKPSNKIIFQWLFCSKLAIVLESITNYHFHMRYLVLIGERERELGTVAQKSKFGQIRVFGIISPC